MSAAKAEFRVLELHAIEAFEGTTSLVFGGVKLGGNAGGVGATVETVMGGVAVTLGVSKLEGESSWIIDSMFKSESSFPVFSNGEGCRAMMLRELLNVQWVAELDAAAAGVVA